MRALLIFSILIAVVAVTTPKYFSRYMEQSTTAERSAALAAEAAAAAEAAVEGRAPPRSASQQVAIEAERDGHFYVDAEINFRPVHLMVDTGATVVALRESDAAAAGIRVRPSDFINPVQTANGTTNAAEAVLESVSVEGIEVRNVRALIIPDDQLSLSLLGGSFLHGLERFEVAGGTLIFEN